MKKPFILIAEDDIDDRMLLQTAFKEIKYEGILNFYGTAGMSRDSFRNNLKIVQINRALFSST